MLELRPFNTLGGANHGWLDAHHHFSFAEYHDPQRMNWGNLRVWNDDVIAPGTGFPKHPHRDMEIITYVREGAISHEDNLGNKGRTEAGDVQVMSAGTGGTSATIGRYIRCQGYETQLMVVDPENSVFLDYWQNRDASLRGSIGSKIEGIGRPRVEPSFIPDVVDNMLRVPDAASVATAHWLETQLGRKVGASTGTNMWGALQLAAQMRTEGKSGSIVTLLCDSGERYLDTYYNAQWVANNIGDTTPWRREIEQLLGQ